MQPPATTGRGRRGRVGRVGIARALAGWIALPVLLVVALTAGLRPGVVALLATAYLVLLWFVAARTKTVSWSFVVLLLLVSMPWAVLTGAAVWAWGEYADPSLPTAAQGSVLAAVGQQSLVALPLLLLPLLKPARVRRFSFADWLLTGVVVGAGYQLVWSLLDPDTALGFSFSLFDGPQPGLPGQPVLTGLVGAGLGFAVAARRHANKSALSAPGRLTWLALAIALPVVLWWLAVSAHASVALDHLAPADGNGEPWLLSLGAAVTGDGRGLGWLLLALLLLALMVDANRLRNAAELEPDPVPHPFHPVRSADAWAGKATRWAGTSSSRWVSAVVWLVATACSVVAFAGRDIGVVFAAVRRSGPGSGAARWTAIGRGRAAGVMVRWIRADAIDLATDPDTRGTLWRTRVPAAVGIVVLLAAAAGLGPYWAGTMPAGAPRPGADLAGAVWPAQVLSTTGEWHETGPGIFWVLGLVAVGGLLLCGADWSTLGMRDTFLTRRPVPQGRRSIGEYLRTTSVSGAVVDLACLFAGMLPSRAETHPSGSAIRAAVGDFRADPPSFIERRRRQLRAGAAPLDDDAEPDLLPVVRKRRPDEDLPALKLADGRLLSPLSLDAEREFAAHLNGLERYEPEPDGRSEIWRADHCGKFELMVSNRPEIWSSGTTERSLRYGLCVLGLWYSGGSSWQIPAGLPSVLPDTLRHRADLEMDRRLIEFTTVVNYPGNPFRAVEVVVSDERVAESVQARMDRLAIPGIVVVAS